MKRRYMVAASSILWMMISATPLVCAQSANLTGQWQVVCDGKSGTTLLTLSQSGDFIAGKWTPAKGAATEIRDGKIAGDTLTFSFIHDKTHFDVTGHLNGDTIAFDVIEVKKGGKPKAIHGRATRGFV
jgi:hypothetical protein